MTWSLTGGGSFAWPAELKATTYPKAQKAGKIDDVLGSLKDAEKFLTGINIPFAPNHSGSPTFIENWQADTKRFIAGDAKKLAGNFAIIKRRLATANADAKATKDKDCKAALAAIGRAVDDYARQASPTAFQAQVDTFMKTAAPKMLHDFAVKHVGKTVAAWKAVTSKGHPGIKAARAAAKGSDDKAVQTVSTQIYNDARDMTQPIGNVLKVKSQNIDVPGLGDVDYRAMTAMLRILQKYGNDTSWTGGDMKKAEAGIKMVAAQSQLFDQIGNKMKV